MNKWSNSCHQDRNVGKVEGEWNCHHPTRTGTRMSQISQQKPDQQQSQEMTAAPFLFTRLHQGAKLRTSDLSELMGSEKIADQTWLFVSPHDDDLCLGAGLLMQAAVASGVDVQTLIVTDGCLGYCTMDQRENIIDIRRKETFESFHVLGVHEEQIHYINYPDGGLLKYQGRRPAEEGEEGIEGYVGLQNAFTYYLRKFRPTRVFVPTHTDLHPDHRYSYSELMISLFHASGAIWPELGPPLVEVPKVYELAVYCDFSTSPNIEVIGNQEVFDRKLKSVEAYRSQAQIAALVKSTREAGPYEYLREINFKLYSPNNYRRIFE